MLVLEDYELFLKTLFKGTEANTHVFSSPFPNRMHCGISLLVGVMRRTAIERRALGSPFVPKPTLDGTISYVALWHTLTHFIFIYFFYNRTNIVCIADEPFGFLIFLNVRPVRAHSIDAAQELFWKQADFGYVKERLSELKTLCKASKPVSRLISSVPTALLSQQEDSTGRNRWSSKQRGRRQ